MPPPSDPSLTSSNVQAALRSVREETLGDVLRVPHSKKKELKEHVQVQSAEGDYVERLIMHYLQSSPRASWEDIAGELLYHRSDTALQEVKQFLQLEEGT